MKYLLDTVQWHSSPCLHLSTNQKEKSQVITLNCPFFGWWWVFLSSVPCFSLHGPNSVDLKEQRNEKDEAGQTGAVDPA